MKTNIFLVIAAMSLMATTSCESQDTGMHISDHYIQTYYDIEEIRAYTQNDWPGVIYIGYEAKEYDNFGSNIRYKELAEHYNDFGYGGAVYPGMYRAVCNEFTGIDVVSDRDFNDIPAGESLAGVVKLLSSSAKHYIDSKYTEGYNWGKDIPDDYIVSGQRLVTEYFDIGFRPVHGTLDSLDPAELVLLHWAMLCLTFTETPAVKEHNLTITFSDAANDFSCELAFTFD